jgi:hypothetical protein
MDEARERLVERSVALAPGSQKYWPATTTRHASMPSQRFSPGGAMESVCDEYDDYLARRDSRPSSAKE